MPEGPEVRQITTYLDEQLAGKQILSIEHDTRSKYRNGIKGYAEFSRHLPATIMNVTCKGKCIVFICQDQDEQNVYITSTLGMEGFWTVGTQPFNKFSNLWFSIGDVSEKEEDEAVDDQPEPESGKDEVDEEQEPIRAYFNDSCKFGNLTLFTDFDDFSRKMSEIGTDYLAFSVALHEEHEQDLDEGEKIEFKDWKTTLQRWGHKQICQFLMEQKFYSGIGNYLKSEILYKSKVKPNRTISTLSGDECQAIFDNTLAIIYEAFKGGHEKYSMYFNPEGECGSSFERAVYDKKVDPLGNPVVRSEFADGRASHWVAEIQV